ncbi:spore germination protein GerPE [Metabacillus fastidiosus]|uniref:spore germination protein GerPE n=1 Tax=Metabacillus fastidiosus TaxID=1458 RepID=UPI000826F6D7|nr:spore germination protein GerPE [Metabacillus fastidiosus]MED4455370.1 spore germination protein GerPE [Metabacillus fastidiosus]MED4461561.1 spore germination protein GerPE [Metabacillus fastidiosus]
MLNRRLSYVNYAYVNAVGISSIFQIGDSKNILLRSKVFAVQRQVETFYTKEGNFSKYSIFNKALPQPVLDEQISAVFFNKRGKIQVNAVKIHGVSTSSAFHIGSTNDVVCETRTKHIRQLLPLNEKKRNIST